MIDIIKCPICGNELEQLKKDFHSRPVFSVKMTVEFIACAYVVYAHCPICGLYVQSPRMSDSEIETYYSGGLYRTWLSQPQTTLDDDEYMRASHDASLLYRLIGTPSRHLDIGSSRGYLLKFMNAGMQVGVEPNVDYNQNTHAVIVPSLDKIPDVQYDLVTAIHSLEHTTDPMSVLHRVDAVASRWIVIEVPSEKSKGGWGRLAHTFHFPEETFVHIAERLSWSLKLIHHTPHTFVVMEK